MGKSKRVDIEILEFISKEKDLSKSLDLIDFVTKHGKTQIYELISEMGKKKMLEWGYADNESYEAKILPDGEDYILEYKNKKSTRKIAYWGIAISIVAILLSGLSLLLQYLKKG